MNGLQTIFWNERVIAAFVTALLGGGVVAAGWFWTHALSRYRDRKLREEQVKDVQRALLAEIRAHVAALEQQQAQEPAAVALALRQRLLADEHVPILPHDANDRIFRAIVEQVHILPEHVIDPVVRYYRLIAVRVALAQDIRSSADNHPDRAAEMLDDYLSLTSETLVEGNAAMLFLSASLKGGPGAVRALMKALEAKEREEEKQKAGNDLIARNVSMDDDAPAVGDGVSRTVSDRRDP
ncbi:hypothetical protein JJJ17_05780 [Paracoccus caeni]|uniref:Uncharacterized protein n=1 Tax=Paracoccus caeni TaxID=657651 RepID=A0A934VXY1_9RHOB|nr:hypothetical protein [Paracoccus caeni]MBK4215432.1 hypothetical protein [Paracoccus caeni]